jgi:hypothetical protein
MPTRITPLLTVLIAAPLLCQQANVQQRSQLRQEWHQEMQSNAMNGKNPAAKNALISQEAQQLSALNLSLQAELALLQKGSLPKDLPEKLKSVEKLAKKLRRELEQ